MRFSWALVSICAPKTGAFLIAAAACSALGPEIPEPCRTASLSWSRVWATARLVSLSIELSRPLCLVPL